MAEWKPFWKDFNSCMKLKYGENRPHTVNEYYLLELQNSVLYDIYQRGRLPYGFDIVADITSYCHSVIDRRFPVYEDIRKHLLAVQDLLSFANKYAETRHP